MGRTEASAYPPDTPEAAARAREEGQTVAMSHEDQATGGKPVSPLYHRDRYQALYGFARWIVSLDELDEEGERRAVKLSQIIDRARAALGGED